jgi:hypothetical protein
VILTPDIEASIVSAIRADPTKVVVLPEHAYGPDGRVVVLVDGLPIDLHRHLHNTLIRPLGYHETMKRLPWVSRLNVNPHLFEVSESRRSTRTHCPNNHAYEGNEAPPNARRYRCRTCLRALLKLDDEAVPNAEKTHCPQRHAYTPENTRIEKGTGKRRCITCKRARDADYMRRLWKESNR